MRTKLVSLAAVGLLAIAAAVLPAAPSTADGPECNLYDHCYGITSYSSGNIDAVGLELWTDCLHLDTPLADVATHEMWLWTSSLAATWIEAGYIRGIVAGGDSQNYFRWFWAEYTGSTFYSHFIAWASVSNWYNMTFSRETSGKWGVYYGGLGGTKVGESVHTSSAGVMVQVGAETTEPKVYSHGKSRYLLWHPVGGSWQSATTGSPALTSGVYSVSQSSGAMEQTSLQNMCSPAPLRATAPPQGEAPSMRNLKTLAVKVAAQYGEKAPTSLQVVSSTRRAAQRAVGAGDQADDRQSFLLQMRGSFVGTAPKGAKLPRGNTLTLTVDAATGEVTDMSLGNQGQGLAKLGAVKAL